MKNELPDTLIHISKRTSPIYRWPRVHRTHRLYIRSAEDVNLMEIVDDRGCYTNLLMSNSYIAETLRDKSRSVKLLSESANTISTRLDTITSSGMNITLIKLLMYRRKTMIP
jgi:hypothetical protein